MNLEICIDNTFKVGPQDKEESMYASHSYFLVVQFSLELPVQPNGCTFNSLQLSRPSDTFLWQQGE